MKRPTDEITEDEVEAKVMKKTTQRSPEFTGACNWALRLLACAVLLTLPGCETGGRYILGAALEKVDPCADCYLEPPGQQRKCLAACEDDDEAPPDSLAAPDWKLGR